MELNVRPNSAISSLPLTSARLDKSPLPSPRAAAVKLLIEASILRDNSTTSKIPATPATRPTMVSVLLTASANLDSGGSASGAGSVSATPSAHGGCPPRPRGATATNPTRDPPAMMGAKCSGARGVVLVLVVTEELPAWTPSPVVGRAGFRDQPALRVQHDDVSFGLETRPADELLHTVPAAVGLVVFRQGNHDPASPYPVLFRLDQIDLPVSHLSSEQRHRPQGPTPGSRRIPAPDAI